MLAIIKKNRKRILNQVCRTLVCLLLCCLLLFNYTIKETVQPVHGAATTAVVIGATAVALFLTAFGIGVAGATSNATYNQWCQDTWNACPVKSGVTAAVDQASGAVQYFFDVTFTNWMKSTITSDDNFTDGGASLYSGFVNAQSPSTTAPATNNSSGIPIIPSYTIPSYSLPSGISHATSFSTKADLLNFFGLGGKSNLQTTYLDFSSTATDWQILCVKYPPICSFSSSDSGILDKDFILSSPNNQCVINFAKRSSTNYSSATFSFNNTMIKSSTDEYVRALCIGTSYNNVNREIPIIMYSYKENGIYYLNYLSHDIYGSGSDGFVTLSSRGAVALPSAPDSAIPNTNVYAKDMSVMSHTLQEILDKMKQYGMTTSDGKVKVNVPATAKDASDVRTKTQADVLGGTIATAADATANASANAGRDTSFPRDADIPDLDLPATLFTKKFPFSIPFDLYNTFTGFKATPVPPKWTIPIVNERLNIHEGITIDFGAYGMDKLALLCRWFVGAFYVLALILATRKLIGAGD